MTTLDQPEARVFFFICLPPEITPKIGEKNE